MIQWTAYDKDSRDIESDSHYLVSDGERIRVAHYARLLGSEGYGWFANTGGYRLLSVTHYAKINMPSEEERGMTYTREQLEQLPSKELTDEESETINWFLSNAERISKMGLSPAFSLMIEILLDIVKLFRLRYKESRQEVDRLKKEKMMLHEICDERYARACILTEEKERLKSQLDDALKTYESIIECATTTLYYSNGPNRRGGLIEIKKCAKEAIQRIKGEKRDEAKETNNH